MLVINRWSMPVKDIRMQAWKHRSMATLRTITVALRMSIRDMAIMGIDDANVIRRSAFRRGRAELHTLDMWGVVP